MSYKQIQGFRQRLKNNIQKEDRMNKNIIFSSKLLTINISYILDLSNLHPLGELLLNAFISPKDILRYTVVIYG